MANHGRGDGRARIADDPLEVSVSDGDRDSTGRRRCHWHRAHTITGSCVRPRFYRRCRA